MSDILDLIIVGSGPAGLSAAIYAQRARLKTLVLEQNYISGGQVVNTYEVDNYPGLPGVSGMELANTFRSHAEKMGTEFVRTKVLDIQEEGSCKKVITENAEYLAKSIILATGARHRQLGVSGEVEFSGMGVSYCATCDGAFFRNKTVAVVGGGDVAVEDAIFLARVCKKVYVIHRRDELRAAKILQENLLALENVEMVWDSAVTEITGIDQVESLLVKNVKNNSSRELNVNGVFIAVGIQPNTEDLKTIAQVDAGGYFIAKEDGITTTPGIFAAGDVRTKELRQIITAASDGANAVTSVQKYLLTL